MIQFIRRVVRLIFEFVLWLLGDPMDSGSTQIAAPSSASSIDISTPELGLASSEPPIYRKSKSLFSYSELIFYRVLLEAVDNKYQVFAKVRMGDFVWLANEPADRKFHNNEVLCKHVDFLVCDQESQKPLLVIELDDSSHNRFDRKKSDEFKDRTFADVGLSILRIKVQQRYSVAELREQILNTL